MSGPCGRTVWADRAAAEAQVEKSRKSWAEAEAEAEER